MNQFKSSSHNPALEKTLKGRVILNGQVYDTSCQCGGGSSLSKLNQYVKNVTMCNPRKLNMVEIRKGFASDEQQIMDIEKIQSLVPPEKPEFTPALTKSLKCLDGRIKDPDGVFGFPGGDFGLFTLMMSEYEIVTNKTLQASDIKRMFTS